MREPRYPNTAQERTSGATSLGRRLTGGDRRSTGASNRALTLVLATPEALVRSL